MGIETGRYDRIQFLGRYDRTQFFGEIRRNSILGEIRQNAILGEIRQNSLLGEIRQNSILLLLFYEELSEPPLTTRGYWQIPLKSEEQKELKTRSSTNLESEV